ncbi:MAG: hypothetical protein OMM_04982 [Candidatus Magnetoglobus multicellularis str. Araruama]|uniref:Uncharacterized protein n=1 Tax=Candidatus Magnetoglobus multicellularis str. Araruama TaxID=890399 RepID=A0A1V1NYQ4_9BACT|nr:MAG: hypothetical protein OMM_04982 [Candidatus Magnetoglobus multicellularis str. Araruama]
MGFHPEVRRALCAGAAGTTTPGTAAPRTATGTRPTTATGTWVSAWLRLSSTEFLKKPLARMKSCPLSLRGK